MGDKPFNIPPAQRREPKRFEPPPWEQEVSGQAEQARPAAQNPVPEPVKEAAPEPAAAGGSAPANADPVPARREAAEKPKVDEALMIELLAQLAEEEEPVGPGLWRIALGVAIFLAALGGVLVIWGMAAVIGSRETGATAATGGATLLLFGAGFIAGAVWLTVRTLRQRGVL